MRLYSDEILDRLRGFAANNPNSWMMSHVIEQFKRAQSDTERINVLSLALGNYDNALCAVQADLTKVLANQPSASIVVPCTPSMEARIVEALQQQAREASDGTG